MQDWHSIEGFPSPLGVTWIPEKRAYNLALYSRFATCVEVLFYAQDELAKPVYCFRFQPPRNKTGPVWHARIPKENVQGAKYYAYRIDGPATPEGGIGRHSFNPSKVLLDPYVRSVFFPETFDRQAATGPEPNAGKAPLGFLCGEEMAFDWEDDTRPHHEGDLVIYELHVRGFTKNPNSAIPQMRRGTYAGIIEKIPYLQELGITAVELMPVFQFDDSEPNYWGYMPVNFFAPHNKYAVRQEGCEPLREFREMVRALHKAGIEVILDVVYNHTGEGDETGPTFSFKGIDNSTYYIPAVDDDHKYANFSGTGNTLNCSAPAVRRLIVDSLQYWASELHVDGFRFDLASIFTRRSDGTINLEDPPIFGEVATNPALSQVRMIAEPWEGNSAHSNYLLGTTLVAEHSVDCFGQLPTCECPKSTKVLQHRFPGTGWMQWNDKFRATVRHFVKSDPGLLSDLLNRLSGSPDIFPDSLHEAHRPYQSINYVTSHDGPTLYDLVSYDTHDSWNCGAPDGDANLPTEAKRLRLQQVKNFCCLLFLSNGTPMFRAGDEFLQSQSGNRNPYQLDNETTWLDWSRLKEYADTFRFFQKMIAFRKAHHSIGRSTFWRDDVRWYGTGAQVSLAHDSHALAYCLHGTSQQDDDLYVMINAYWEPLVFVVQEGSPERWKRVIDTSRECPHDFIDAGEGLDPHSLLYTVSARSISVLVSVQKGS